MVTSHIEQRGRGGTWRARVHQLFDHSDGVIIGDVATIQSYVDRDHDGNLVVDVYASDRHLEGGGSFRYRIEYVGPAPEVPAS